MSILTIVQNAQRRIGLLPTSTVIGSSDSTDVHMLSLAEECATAASKITLQNLVRQASFATVAAVDQGLLTGIATDISSIVNDTMYNDDANRYILGPQAPAAWVRYIYGSGAGALDKFRIKAGHLHITPAPTAGQTVVFEYTTNLPWESTGGTGKATPTVDSDLCRIDEEYITLSLIWNWKSAKGFDFTTDLAKASNYLSAIVTQDKPNPTLSLDNLSIDRPFLRASWMT